MLRACLIALVETFLSMVLQNVTDKGLFSKYRSLTGGMHLAALTQPTQALCRDHQPGQGVMTAQVSQAHRLISLLPLHLQLRVQQR